MHSHKLIAALSLAVGLVAPVALAASPAAAAAGSCRVELYDIDALNVGERDGHDELRFLVGGNLFPNNGWFTMDTGDDGDPADFGHPSTVVTSNGTASFNLREVTPPWVNSGASLGSVIAHGSTCAPLAVGAVDYEEDFIDGTHGTFYSYKVKLKLTGL
ncbi:hypothetical protein AB0B45_45010 [Nonomuraea sp. NPDC049152]|uniref:hypothetical protein n=1 Tax=Nonomuraea sp. NPDC049152 TaxID=3154350 RepID=UPI0033C1B739